MGKVDRRGLLESDPLAPSSLHQKVGEGLFLVPSSQTSVVPFRPHRHVFKAHVHSPAVQCSPQAGLGWAPSKQPDGVSQRACPRRGHLLGAAGPQKGRS